MVRLPQAAIRAITSVPFWPIARLSIIDAAPVAMRTPSRRLRVPSVRHVMGWPNCALINSSRLWWAEAVVFFHETPEATHPSRWRRSHTSEMTISGDAPNSPFSLSHVWRTCIVSYCLLAASFQSTTVVAYFEKFSFSIFTARCTLVQSAVLRSHVVCLSVRPSVRLWRWWIVIT